MYDVTIYTYVGWTSEGLSYSSSFIPSPKGILNGSALP